jgi:exodeoxyribonuclease-5
MVTEQTKAVLKVLLSHLTIEPTDDQRRFLVEFAGFLTDADRFRVFQLKGYAGTGKTTMMGTLVKSLPAMGWSVQLMAPTGRAAKVLSNQTGQTAFTIHKKIYSLKTKAGYSWFELSPNLHSNTLFIIDEASMIGNDGGAGQGISQRHLLEDVLRYIYRGKNCIALFVGDPAQLPPVGLTESPALDETFIRDEFRLSVTSVELKQVVRQASDSGILFNATAIRKQLESKDFTFPQFVLEGYPDVKRITGFELQDELEWAFGQFGSDGVRVVTRSNKRSNQFNQQIRSRIFWIENEINGGDELMVVKNNYYWIPSDSPAGFIANGDTMTVQKVRKIKEEHGLQFADLVVKLTDYPDLPELELKAILDTLMVEGPSLPAETGKKLFESLSETYDDEPNPKKRNEKIFNDPLYNALQVKFAWAVTCHKAQGGHWPVVFVDQGYLTDEMMDREFLRWLYTAVTRATVRLYLVNFNDKFF